MGIIPIILPALYAVRYRVTQIRRDFSVTSYLLFWKELLTHGAKRRMSLIKSIAGEMSSYKATGGRRCVDYIAIYSAVTLAIYYDTVYIFVYVHRFFGVILNIIQLFLFIFSLRLYYGGCP